MKATVYIGTAEKYSSAEILREAYQMQYGVPMPTVGIARSERGKPFFVDEQMPYFSISHSGAYIACVFAEEEIGLDLQKLRRVPDGVMKRYLRVAGADVRQQTLEWTKFESYGKLLGSGIPLPGGIDYTDGYFLSSDEVDGYLITVCLRRPTYCAIQLLCCP